MATLLSYLTARRADADALLKKAHVDLEKAREKETTAVTAHATAGRTVDTLSTAADAARRALAASSGRTEGADLVAELDALTAEHAAAVAALAAADFERRAAAAAVRRLAGVEAALTARLAADEVRVKQATATEVVRKTQADLLAVAPLKTLKADAVAARTVKLPPALARIEEIPKELRDYVLARRNRAANARKALAKDVTDAAADVDKLYEAANSPDRPEKIARAWAVVNAADEARSRYILASPGELARAVAALVAVADTTRDRITPEEKARIAAVAESTEGKPVLAALKLLVEGVDAAKKKLADEQAKPDGPGKESAVAAAEQALKVANEALAAFPPPSDAEVKKLAAARTARDDKHLAWEAERRLAAALADPDADPKVVAARADLDAAIQKYRDAQAAFKASAAGVFRDWELAVPDAAWRRFHDCHDADATLARLSATDPAALGTAVVKADADLAAAQKDADDRADAVAAKSSALVTAADRLAADADARGGRVSP